MSKVICDICGTSYPDTATQCPICGCVRPAETVAVEEPAQEGNGYTYVKGGRFSKSNVRKRNHTAMNAPNSADTDRSANEPKREKPAIDKKRLGLIIVLVCLFLVVVSMAIYIVHSLIRGEDSSPDNEAISAEVACTGLQVSPLDFTMTKPGEVLKLEVVCTPDNTTDAITFTENSGNSVVKVDQNGNVTCVGDGKAVITVTCGQQKKECRVICTIEEPEPPEVTDPEIKINLFSYHVELNFARERFLLYANGDIPAAELTWVSEDTAVATVDNDGTVYAVNNGETVVHAKYNDKIIASSHIKCNFKDFEVDDSQEGGETVPFEEYHFGSIYGELKPEGDNLYGTSLKIGDKIQFGLIHKTDRSKNIYFKWERVNPDDPDQSVITSEDQLYIIRSGEPNSSYCLFKATHEGKEYFLMVRYLA